MIVWGVGLSSEIPKTAEAETFTVVEGNMCGTAMRGADAPPGSKATSRTKRMASETGRSRVWPVSAYMLAGPHREGEEP